MTRATNSSAHSDLQLTNSQARAAGLEQSSRLTTIRRPSPILHVPRYVCAHLQLAATNPPNPPGHIHAHLHTSIANPSQFPCGMSWSKLEAKSRIGPFPSLQCI